MKEDQDRQYLRARESKRNCRHEKELVDVISGGDRRGGGRLV